MTDLKNSVVYQIYTKSFKDSNGDGIGDIRGVIEKLDYIKSLGVDYIWMTPFFQSPLNDNGYDVADYLSIDPLFGTMDDVDQLISEAGNRGMGLMFDMAFNHTSTEHEWFQKALAGDQHYMNYYIFKEGGPSEPPTNWISKFGGSAWEYVPHLKKWYLHLFDKTQADLNWDNKEVRDKLKEVITFWKNKGVKGFRFDVVNLISKPDIFRDDETGDGRKYYTDGPHVHEYLKELVADTGMEDMITVGEMSSTSLNNCIRYSNPFENELSMTFSFHHLKVDYKDGDKWEVQEPDYGLLKKLFKDWQEGMQEGDGWNAVFWCNHDQPRSVTRFGNDELYWKESAKMLATCIHCMRGTPYIFQGEEIGTTNAYFTDIHQFQDVESKNYYDIMRKAGKTNEEAIEILQARSRDNGRTPMQWSKDQYGGFSEVKPWIDLPENYKNINVEVEELEDDSILQYYKDLIKLRKRETLIADGKIEFLFEDCDDVLVYKRYSSKEEILVLNNLKEKDIILDLSYDISGYEKLLGNYNSLNLEKNKITLRAYECIVCKFSSK